MKYILFLLLISVSCAGQSKETHVCPEGYKYMYSMGTSSLYIQANECVPDSMYKKLWMDYFKNSCEEGSSGMMVVVGKAKGFNYSHSYLQTWDSVNETCKVRDSYQKRIGNKWVDITKDEFSKTLKATKPLHLK